MLFRSKAIERAQTTVEQRNGEIRKNVLKYDEVMNEQRKVIYKRRDQILDGEDLRSAAMEYLAEAVDALIETHCASAASDEWDLGGLATELTLYWPNSVSQEQFADCNHTDEIYDLVMNSGRTRYVPGKHRAEQAMNTIVLERLNTGDVIEMTTVDNEVITVLVLLATDDALVLDPCNDETPFVLRLEELTEYRRFDAESMFADA